MSRFTVRDYKDYEGLQFKPEKSFLNRINGELCIFNTIEIIKRYEPNFYVIENPAYDRIWEYIDRILGFKIPFENLAYYGNYGYPLAKPTKFGSDVDLHLKSAKIGSAIHFNNFSRSYNERSNIPINLIEDIYRAILKKGVTA